MKRITASHIEGMGDLGYSQVLDGYILPKDHPACKVQGAIERLSNEISSYLAEYDSLYHELDIILLYVRRNIKCLAGLCWKKGDSQWNVIGGDALDVIETETQRLKSLLSDLPNFIDQSTSRACAIDAIRLQVRELETWYTTWKNCPEMRQFRDIQKDSVIEDGIMAWSEFLNRFSSFLFSANRWETMLYYVEKGISPSEIVWTGGIEVFNSQALASELSSIRAIR